MPNSVPQNIVIFFQMARPVMTYTLSMMANERQAEREGTNRKWRGRGKLESRQVDDVEINHWGAPMRVRGHSNRHGSQAVSGAMIRAV